jgi:hypothetical protein
MQVGIKDFNVAMDIKTSGIELEIYDTDGAHRGDLVITKTKLIWCHGKTRREKGVKIRWEDFIDYMECL